MNLDLYEREIYHEGYSVFTYGETVSGTVDYEELSQKFPVLKAFLDDDDLQEIRIVSANIGFSRIYCKRFKNRKDRQP